MTFSQIFSLLLRGLCLALQMLVIFALLTIAALAGAFVGLLVRVFFLPMELVRFLRQRRAG